jgi:hypothetical protein
MSMCRNILYLDTKFKWDWQIPLKENILDFTLYKNFYIKFHEITFRQIDSDVYADGQIWWLRV